MELCSTFCRKFCGKRIQRRTGILYLKVNTESSVVYQQQAQNYKSTVLQHKIGMRERKRKKTMPNLFPATSLSWEAIPSLESEHPVSHVWTGMALRKPGGDNQNFKRDESPWDSGPTVYNSQDRE